MSENKLKSYRLPTDAIELLAAIAKKEKRTIGATLEILIREAAKKAGVKGK